MLKKPTQDLYAFIYGGGREERNLPVLVLYIKYLNHIRELELQSIELVYWGFLCKRQSFSNT